MAKTNLIFSTLQFFAEPDPNGGQDPNASGGANGGQEPPKVLTQEEIEKQVNERLQAELEKQKTTLEESIRKQIQEEQDNANLTAEEKLAKEREKLEAERKEFETLRKNETLKLNAEKIKSTYLKGGVGEELANILVGFVGEDYSKASEVANSIITQLKNSNDKLVKDTLAGVQKNQPRPNSNTLGGNDDNKNTNNDDSALRNKFFKKM